MNVQDLAARLSAQERACLRHLSHSPETELAQFERDLVARLLVLGLVERVMQLAYPVMPQRERYRLTTQGRSVLAALSDTR